MARAWRRELMLPYKPGLVYSTSAGAHSDMDYDLMFGSILALRRSYLRHREACGLVELGKAVEALAKAKEVDPKGSKAKDIDQMMTDIHTKLGNEALSEYLAGNFKKAAELFKTTAACAENPLMGKVDTLNTYYTALVSNMAGEKEQAIDYYKKCLDKGIFQNGNTFSNLAEVYKNSGDTVACKETLEKGFVQFPENDGILIGLINLYIDSKDDTGRLFELIHAAQNLNPTNASLFYVEGNVYKQLGDVENAAKFYAKSAEVDPNYTFGPLGLGALYYDKAIELCDNNKQKGRIAMRVAQALAKNGSSSTESYLQKAATFDSSFSGRCNLIRAQIAASKKDYSNALAYASRAASEDASISGTASRLRTRIQEAQRRQNEYDKANAEYKAQLEKAQKLEDFWKGH